MAPGEQPVRSLVPLDLMYFSLLPPHSPKAQETLMLTAVYGISVCKLYCTVRASCRSGPMLCSQCSIGAEP